MDLVALPECCYRCGRLTRGVVGVLVGDEHGQEHFREFDSVAHVLCDLLDPTDLAAADIGPIRARRSRQRGTYISNGCVHCGAILGSFPLREAYHEYLSYGGRRRDLIVRVPTRSQARSV